MSRLLVIAWLLSGLWVRPALAQEEPPDAAAEAEEEEEPDEEAEPTPDSEPPVVEPAPEPSEDAAEEDRVPIIEKEPIEREGIDALVPQGPAPALLKGFSIEGELIDSEEVVRAFLEPVIDERDRWSDTDQKAIVDFLYDIGYHTSIRNEPLPSGGVHATLALKPVTLIRQVKVDVDIELIARLLDPVFSEEIRRRMNLRPGSPLELGREDRRQQLSEEANRLAFYLRTEGFFEAEVTITERQKGVYSSELIVGVDPGPPYKIGDIRVTGNTSIETDAISEIFRHERCYLLRTCVKRFSREQLNKDVEKLVELYHKRGYPGVRVRTDFDMRHSFKRDTRTVEFTVEVRERRKIDVVFEGNDEKRRPADELREALTLSQEGSYDDVEVAASAEAIRRYYQRRGFFEASVTWERVRFGVFERIIFTIDEGPKLPVRQIAFRGNEEVPTERLGEAIKTQTFQRIIVGDLGGFATSLQLRQDAQRLQDLYRRLGYRDARVRVKVARAPDLVDQAPALAAAVAASGDADGLYVHFVIQEGRRVEVAGVQFDVRDGRPADTRKLQRAVKLRAGAPFLEETAREDARRLRRHYFSRGYPRAEVETEFENGEGEGPITIVHRITENTPARIGKIALRGNFKTEAWVIREELEFEEGDKLTIEAAERAQNNLRQSGLFSSVQIDYKGFDDPRQEVVNVLVRVEERHDNLGMVEAGVGYSTDTKGFVEGRYQLRNIVGTGARFDTRALYGQERKLVEGKIALPRWIQHRALRTSFLVELASFFEIENTERFGDLTSIGASLAATKEGREGFWQGWLLSLRYDFRQRVRDEDLIRPAGASDDIRRSKVTTRSSAVGPILVIDKRRDRRGRRNPLTPSRGFRLELRALFAEDFMVGSNRFVKFGGSGQHFLSLGDRFVLSNGIRYDHGVPLGGEVLLPDVERFFAGGDTTVRGFEEDRLATEIVEEQLPPLGTVNQFQVLPAGGNIRFIHNLELQVRVWDEPPGIKFPIASAIFFDTGLVTNSLVGFETSDFRHSIGVALARWMTPFGSLSVEYAVPLNPQLGDNPRGRYHVNFGFLF